MSYLGETLISKKFTYETLINTDKFVLGRCKILPDADFRIHKHEISETYIITEGTGEVYDNDHWRPVKVGDIIVFLPGTLHGCRTADPGGIKFVYYFHQGPFSSIKYYFS